MQVWFNRAWCSEADQKTVHEALPEAHDYGDRWAALPGGRELLGRQAHDAHCSAELRMRARKRCTIGLVKATHTGSGAARQALPGPIDVLVSFCATPDWHAVGLDAETFFLRPYDNQNNWPRIGPYMFMFTSFLTSTYEDLVMGLMAIKAEAIKADKRAHLKLVPLGVGPTIRTRFGDLMGPLLIPVYLVALQYALLASVDDSWVQCLEFVDSMHGQMSPYVAIPKVQIISGQSRDAFDFSRSDAGLKAVLAPCDSFCRIGGQPRDKTLAATLANNSNLRDVLQVPLTFVAWPL